VDASRRRAKKANQEIDLGWVGWVKEKQQQNKTTMRERSERRKETNKNKSQLKTKQKNGVR
jgi:hypothetical protein